MSASTVTEAEVRIAKRLLALLGAPASDLNIAAIAAWMRSAGGLDAKGHNIFLVRAGQAGASRFASGRNFLRNGAWYVRYRTLDAALKGVAYILKYAYKHEPRGYLGSVLRALKREKPGDALVALALSNWDNAHYGVATGQDPALAKFNQLLRVYLGFRKVWHPPVVKRTTQKAKPPKALPAMPRALQPPPPFAGYVDPWAVKRFYEARYEGRHSLPW